MLKQKIALKMKKLKEILDQSGDFFRLFCQSGFFFTQRSLAQLVGTLMKVLVENNTLL